MNKFDKAINKKTSELITKNLLGQEVTEEEFRNLKLLQEQLLEKK